MSVKRTSHKIDDMSSQLVWVPKYWRWIVGKNIRRPFEVAVSLDQVALSVLEIHALWAKIFLLKNKLKKTPGNLPHKPR